MPTKDLLLDRGMMGDGVIDLPGIRRMVEAAGFHGHQEVEIFSAEDWWKRPGDEVLKHLRRALQHGLLGLLFAHDLIRKPVPTFRDHALLRRLLGSRILFGSRTALAQQTPADEPN